MGGVRYWQLNEEMKLPVPTMDFSVPSGLATVYWVKPPHENIAVLLNAMFNTPGNEGVIVFLEGGDYELIDTIRMHPNDAIIGKPLGVFRVNENFNSGYIFETVDDCRGCLTRNILWGN